MASGNGLRARLIDLFQKVAADHHRAYIETDGDDPEWPIWYAERLQGLLNPLLDVGCTRSELVYLLVKVEKERVREAPGADWADYYAGFFLERYREMEGHMPQTPRAGR